MERRIGVLVNPTAGRGRGARTAGEVLRLLASRGDQVVELRGDTGEHGAELAAKAVAQGLDVLVAVGGDGTMHLALQAVAGTDTALGIIPVGTGNDGAASVGIPCDAPAEAVAVVLAGNARAFDVGLVRTAEGTSRYFLCVCSTGFDSLVNERANALTRPRGDARYVVALLAELRRFAPVPYRTVLDGASVQAPAMLVSLGNGPTFGGGMRVCPDADLHDGALDLLWVHTISKPELLRVFPRIYRGTHVTHPAVEQRRVRSAHLAAPGMLAYADGERIGPLPVDVTSVPDGVRILVPR
ncbi:MAG: YegS/Rv2252/BmrU family lipid kinase [Candidatus Nanopelagicales bacterium]|nr:YegS/Rv2252/BmrU family lipid kinase [Candidatus Nanopelagicales bacterium]